jgi:hypothetical protein
MMQKTYYRAMTHTEEAGPQLNLSWLPEEEPRLLIGITEYFMTHVGVILPEHRVKHLQENLSLRKHFDLITIGGEAITLTPANKGDPYREGMNLTIESDCKEHSNTVFIEDRDVHLINKFLLT